MIRYSPLSRLDSVRRVSHSRDCPLRHTHDPLGASPTVDIAGNPVCHLSRSQWVYGPYPHQAQALLSLCLIPSLSHSMSMYAKTLTVACVRLQQLFTCRPWQAVATVCSHVMDDLVRTERVVKYKNYVLWLNWLSTFVRGQRLR